MKQVKVSTDVFGNSVGHTYYECGGWKIAILPASLHRPIDVVVESGQFSADGKDELASIIAALLTVPPK